MATLREIRRRINAIKSTQKITKAMKMVSAARLRRAQDAILKFRPYASEIDNLFLELFDKIPNYAHPLFFKRQVKKILLLVLTSDRGLCGSFNSNIFRAIEDFINKKLKTKYENVKVSLICVGKKGFDYFNKRNYRIDQKYLNFYADLSIDNVRNLIEIIKEKFLTGEVDKVYAVYNEFISVISQKVKIEELLPIKIVRKVIDKKNVRAIYEFIYEPDKEKILNSLVPKFFEVKTYRMFLESYASEQGARMTAMDNATENAKELLRILSLSYNRARQAAITKELLEIVAGASALKEIK